MVGSPPVTENAAARVHPRGNLPTWIQNPIWQYSNQNPPRAGNIKSAPVHVSEAATLSTITKVPPPALFRHHQLSVNSAT